MLYGQDGADVIEGNDGADWASGGDGDDLVYGGTRASGAHRRRPGRHRRRALRRHGRDIIIGDNGTVDDPSSSADAPAIPFDLAGTTPTPDAATCIYGGAGDDTAYGGLGDDRVNGGDDADHLEGNNGIRHRARRRR